MSVEQKTNLIEEINKNRKGHYEILKRIEDYRSKLNVFKIDEKDFRARGRAAEIVKAMTEVIKAELDVRKTIDGSAKLEYELRTKLQSELEQESGDSDIGDIRNLVSQVENELNNLQKKSKKEKETSE